MAVFEGLRGKVSVSAGRAVEIPVTYERYILNSESNKIFNRPVILPALDIAAILSNWHFHPVK